MTSGAWLHRLSQPPIRIAPAHDALGAEKAPLPTVRAAS